MKKKKNIYIYIYMRERWITFLCRNWESYAQNVRELQIYSKMMRIRRMKIKEDKMLGNSNIKIDISEDMKCKREEKCQKECNNNLGINKK